MTRISCGLWPLTWNWMQGENRTGWCGKLNSTWQVWRNLPYQLLFSQPSYLLATYSHPLSVLKCLCAWHPCWFDCIRSYAHRASIKMVSEATIKIHRCIQTCSHRLKSAFRSRVCVTHTTSVVRGREVFLFLSTLFNLYDSGDLMRRVERCWVSTLCLLDLQWFLFQKTKCHTYITDLLKLWSTRQK